MVKPVLYPFWPYTYCFLSKYTNGILEKKGQHLKTYNFQTNTKTSSPPPDYKKMVVAISYTFPITIIQEVNSDWCYTFRKAQVQNC